MPLQAYGSTVTKSPDEDPKHAAYGLMTRGANSLMAGFELALNGYFWEPPVILRTALEEFSSAWDIVHNPKRFLLWKADKKFSSTDSVSNCKEINPVIGKLYGMLSNLYTHIGPINSSPALVMNGNDAKFQFFGSIRSGKENIREGEIYLSLLLTHVCLQMTELCFHAYINEFETVERIPGKMEMKTKVSDRHRIFADKAMAHFKNQIDEPLSAF